MSGTQPIITIAGERVALGPLRRDLIPVYHAWISNLETTQYLSNAGSVHTLDEEADWYEWAIRLENERRFTMYFLPDFVPIGTVNLHQISHKHRKDY